MKRDYSKWCSVALITAIYVLAGVAGVLLFIFPLDIGNVPQGKGNGICDLVADPDPVQR